MVDVVENEWMTHYGELKRYARRFDGGEDLVQETFARALAAKARYRPGTNARAWLYRILRNAWLSTVRSSQTEARALVALGWQHEIEEHAQDREGEQMARERAARIGEGAMPEIVALRSAGLSYRELSLRLGVPIGTVMSRLHRARRRLAASAANGDSRRSSRICCTTSGTSTQR